MTQKRINADSLQVSDSQKVQSLPNRLPRLDCVKSRNDDSPHNSLKNLPLHFHKNSPKDSTALTFSPKIERFTEPKAFALKAKDDALRLNSSSGGAFSLIAQYVLNRGGVVFGASFDENLNVVHRFIENPAEMDTLRRSKYVESFIGDTYKQARDFLKAGRLVLFSGVQCQIHGLNAFLRKPYPNLLTIEVICNSIPSPKIWDIYRESLKQELGEKLTSFNFRTKIFRWENSALIAHTKTKQKIIEQNWDSPYIYNAWATHIITRKSCGNCYSKGFVSGADFTIGDFWGIREYHADFVDELGVSCVLAHNQKALEILDSLQDLAHIIKTTASIINTSNATLHSGFINADRESVLHKVIATYERTKDAKKAMAILSQYAQNPNPKITPLRHYYLVWKNDPLRKTISNALKKARKWLLRQNQQKSKDNK